MRRFPWTGLLLIVVLFAAVELYARSGAVNAIILPAPSRIFSTYLNTEFVVHLATQAVLTIGRAFIGFVLAFLIAVPLGLIMGTVPSVRATATPLIELLRPIPSSAMIPVAILFLGLGAGMITFVIWFGTLWPLLMNSMYGAQNVIPQHRELGSLLRLTKPQFFYLVVLPSAVPSIFAGARISISIALILAVTAEMLAGQNGLGFWLLDYERAFRFQEMYAILLLLALIGLIVNGGLVASQRSLGRRFPSLS